MAQHIPISYFFQCCSEWIEVYFCQFNSLYLFFHSQNACWLPHVADLEIELNFCRSFADVADLWNWIEFFNHYPCMLSWPSIFRLATSFSVVLNELRCIFAGSTPCIYFSIHRMPAGSLMLPILKPRPVVWVPHWVIFRFVIFIMGSIL